MLDKIKGYYTQYKIYVNIGIGVIVLYVVYKMVKK